MKVYLSNCGHKYVSELKKNTKGEKNSDFLLLNEICKNIVEEIPTEVANKWIANGYCHLYDNQPLEDIALRYKRNPLENVKSIVFEITTLCNFNCLHCRNGYIPRITEHDFDKLQWVAEVFKQLNINKFVFIGGEITKFGDSWLKLTANINKNNDCKALIFTNGWWVEQTDFEAAGKKYSSDIEYLSDLKQNGVTHVVFSIDGDENLHDKWRQHKGLFQRILNSIDRVKASGLLPRISGVMKQDELNMDYMNAMITFAKKIYDKPKLSAQEAFLLLQTDDTNTFSNFIDIGNGASIKSSFKRLDSMPKEMAKCKAFYRPAPNLRINANGELSVCPLLGAGEGYGNVHDTDIITILNNFQQNFVYQLHANNLIANYIPLLTPEIFGEKFDHPCSIRTVLTMIAKKTNKIAPEAMTKEKLLKILKEVSEVTGIKF